MEQPYQATQLVHIAEPGGWQWRRILVATLAIIVLNTLIVMLLGFLWGWLISYYELDADVVAQMVPIRTWLFRSFYVAVYFVFAVGLRQWMLPQVLTVWLLAQIADTLLALAFWSISWRELLVPSSYAKSLIAPSIAVALTYLWRLGRRGKLT